MRLAIAIPTYNRAAMLDAVLHAYVPTCEALGVGVFLSDNGSNDATPEVCAAWAARTPLVRFTRHATTVPVGRNIMSAMEGADADFAWFAGDDDFLVPDRIGDVLAVLEAGDPSAVVVRTIEVPRPDFATLDAPLAAQLAPVLAHGDASADARTRLDHADAAGFFAAKHYRLPAPSVIYRRASTLASAYDRYIPTHHPHIGALFDALAREQDDRGRVDVVELTAVHSISLTVHDAHGKQNWSDIFRFLALEGFPLWFSLLPTLYEPHLPAAKEFHRHIFRAAFDEAHGSADTRRAP